jgi:hypothetical protein
MASDDTVLSHISQIAWDCAGSLVVKAVTQLFSTSAESVEPKSMSEPTPSSAVTFLKANRAALVRAARFGATGLVFYQVLKHTVDADIKLAEARASVERLQQENKQVSWREFIGSTNPIEIYRPFGSLGNTCSTGGNRSRTDAGCLCQGTFMLKHIERSGQLIHVLLPLAEIRMARDSSPGPRLRPVRATQRTKLSGGASKA